MRQFGNSASAFFVAVRGADGSNCFCGSYICHASKCHDPPPPHTYIYIYIYSDVALGR
jgi:hypothetical protein